MSTNRIKRASKTPIILKNGGQLSKQTTDSVSGIVSSGLDLVSNVAGLAKINDTSNIKEVIKQHGNTQVLATTNEQLMSQWADQSNMENIKYEDVGGKSKGERTMGVLKGAGSGAALGTAIAPGIGTVIGAGVGALGSWIGGLFGKKKAKKEQANLNTQVAKANTDVFDSFANRADVLDRRNDFGMAANYFAQGGRTDASNWNTGLTFFNQGNTHENNPIGGIPVGVDEQGAPNLVEEGEVRYNNYVFSNRLYPTKKSLKQFGIPDKHHNKTFAKIAELFSQESLERPNDPISKNGIEDSMTKLMLAQEDYKAMRAPKQQKNVFNLGGPLNIKPLPALEDKVFVPLTESELQIDKYARPSDPVLRGINYINNPLNNAKVAQDAQFNAATTQDQKDNNKGSWTEHLRYAPVLGSSIGVLSDLMGWTNKPDYSRADAIQSDPVAPKPVGNYLTYQPLDRDFYQNKINAQAGASRSGIINQSGGNRAQATAGLLASDYNALSQMGDMARRAEEYNMQQRHQVEGFNKATNMFNSQQALQADLANSQQDFRARVYRSQMLQDIDDRVANAKSINLTNFFNNIGEVGRESFSRNMIKTNPALYYTIDSRGRITYKNMSGLSPEQQQEVKLHAENQVSGNKYKDGGLIYTTW